MPASLRSSTSIGTIIPVLFKVGYDDALRVIGASRAKQGLSLATGETQMRWMRPLTAAFAAMVALAASAQARGAGSEDWDKGNLIANGDFSRGELGGRPEG